MRNTAIFIMLLIFGGIVANDASNTKRSDSLSQKVIKDTTILSKEISPLTPKQSIYDQLVFIKSGEFIMGSNKGDNDEFPKHRVNLKSYYINKYEITNAQYIKFLNSINCDEHGWSEDSIFGKVMYINIPDSDCPIGYEDGKFVFLGSYSSPLENCPAIEVTWYGANAYCKWKGGRLPTEAEWEYAARGGVNNDSFRYSGGEDINDFAQYKGNNNRHTQVVGSKKPNSLGIYDMSGNVWEWCSDIYSNSYYQKYEGDNPQGPPEGDSRVARGGGWAYDSKFCTVSVRNAAYPQSSDHNIGFRMVLDSIPHSILANK